MLIENFMDFVRSSTCSFTTVETAKERLKKEKFQELSMGERWVIQPGGKYYVEVYQSSLIAFTVGKNFGEHNIIHVAAAHTDSPCFVIKPNPVMKEGKYAKINVEAYGGSILNTWLDRPLGVAGMVVLKGKGIYEPRMITWDSKRPVMVIPNLAVHMNRDVNKGVELNKQKDMIPLAGGIEEQMMEQDYLLNLMAQDLGSNKEDILDYQLYLYNYEESHLVGVHEEFLMAPRIDNLASVFACVEGITKDVNEEQLSVIALFDHEEVGSRTKQGAASEELSMVLKRIYESLGESVEKLYNAVAGGFFLSLDGAHATHPNYKEKSDPTNGIYLNDGVVLKKSANQSYSTDAVSAAVVKELCREQGISCKEYVNRSDIPGGSTLGAIASTKLPMRMADVGVPMLAMHSSMEMTGRNDVEQLVRLVKAFL